MELDIQADIDVLNDLLQDVAGEEEQEGDEEAFFDTDGADVDQDGGGDTTTDNILSQLNAVTNLDDDEMQGENADEFHDSTSIPAESASSSELQTIPPVSNPSESANERGREPALKEMNQPEKLVSLSSEDVVQAVLDLATSAHDRDDPQEQASGSAAQSISEDGHKETIAPHGSVPSETETNTHIQEHDLASISLGTASHQDTDKIIGDADMESTVENEEVETNDSRKNNSTTVLPDSDPSTDALVDTQDTDVIQGIELLPGHEDEEGVPAAPPQSAVLPPPAPVIVGTMNPVEDDSDGDSDVSEGIEEGESASLPPPLSLREEEDDDDDDILEVDAAVVSSLEIEQVQRISNRSRTSERQSLQDKAEDNITKEPDNPLLKALPVSKVDSTINFTLGEEVRVAHVTTLEPNGDFSDLHKVAGDTGVKVDGIFGISYQSMRKKNDESKNADDFADEAGYSLPSGPAFPDEREFENEVELSNDLVFSVATASSTGPGEKGDRGAVGAEDDEFVFDIQETPNADILSDEMLKSRRESLEAQKAKEEEKLLKELKHATDEEKRLLVSNNMPEASVINSTQEANDAVAEADALSLTELHGIYKRGLGDQEVLMNDDEKLATTNSESDQAVPVGRSMSVMGRILSKPYGTETIQEEENDSETEDYEVKDNRSDKTATECPKDKNLTENGDIDKPSEWKEITLVQHSGLQKDEKTGPSSTVKQQNSLEAGSCITYAEAADYYAEIPDVMQHRNMIVPEDFPRGSCLGCLSRPRLVFDGAIEERDRVFCIAATAFDTRNNVIVAVLQTIYKKIMKNTRSISLIGRHWEDIGFQGTDPSTDLRGCGVLSLLQMLCLVDTHPDLAHRFHTLSQHVTRHFPFACVLINITLQCVVALRTGALYPECNKHSNVFSGMNRLYLALTLHLHDAMQSRTEEIPVIMKDVLDRGRVNPTKTINAAFDGPTLRSPSTGVPMKIGGDNKEADTNMQFTEIGLHAIDDS